MKTCCPLDIEVEFMPFVYMLRCCDNSLYTGYTTDLSRRLQEHNQGTASKYTRGRRPVQYVYVEEHPDKSSALKREQAIKMMKKSAKEALAKGTAFRLGS
jgi:putative endonuclease